MYFAELSYVGESCYGVKIKTEDQSNCIKTAKTAEKLALNLIEFVPSKEDVLPSTVYGNKQHNKKAIPIATRKAIRCKSYFYIWLMYSIIYH